MKRKFTVVLLALAAALLLGLSVFFVACESGTGTEQSDEGEAGGEDPALVPDVSDKLVFTLNDEGTAYSVTDMDNSAAGSVTIPATYNGLPVTSIGNSAFYNCSRLMNITISENVKSIGTQAFENCSSLTEVTIPANVASIGLSAFSGCSALTKIYYNAAAIVNLTSNSRVFYNAGSKSAGVTVIFGESVTSIPSYLFYVQSSLVGAPNLVSVKIGSNVTSIGDSAFSGCSSLTGITIPEGVTSIGDSAFSGCSCLTEINYNAVAVTDCGDGVFFGAGSNSDGIAVIFGESVISIPSYLFGTSLSSSYFSPNIVSVTVGSNVASIGWGAFDYCNSLMSVYISDLSAWCAIEFSFAANPLLNGGNLYLNDELVTELLIPEEVTNISSHAFSGCSSLTVVTISEGVTNIGSGAFSGCSNLAEITIPASVTNIGDSAFSGCSGLTDITVAEGNAVYHSAGDCLIETETKTLILGCQNSVIPTDGSVTSIGNAFSGCSNLT